MPRYGQNETLEKKKLDMILHVLLIDEWGRAMLGQLTTFSSTKQVLRISDLVNGEG